MDHPAFVEIASFRAVQLCDYVEWDQTRVAKKSEASRQALYESAEPEGGVYLEFREEVLRVPKDALQVMRVALPALLRRDVSSLDCPDHEVVKTEQVRGQ